MDNVELNNEYQRVPRKPLKKTLSYLVERNKIAKLPDLELIKEWFTENNLEEEGIKLLADLSYSKITKLETSLNSIRNHDLSLIDVRKNLKNEPEKYSEEVADNLTMLERAGLLNLNLRQYTFLYDWAKENIHKINAPKVYYIPTLHYLASYDIYFKNMPKEELDKFNYINYEDARTREY